MISLDDGENVIPTLEHGDEAEWWRIGGVLARLSHWRLGTTGLKFQATPETVVVAAAAEPQVQASSLSIHEVRK